MTIKKSVKLKVSWTDKPLSYSNDRCFSWTGDELSALGECSQAEANDRLKLEKLLGWSAGSIAVLQRAFELNLDRFTSWDLSGIRSNQLGKFEQAARVYKRGVPVGPSGRMKRSKGSYNILVTADRKIVDRRLESAEFIVVDRNVENAWPYLEDFADILYSPVAEPHKSLASVAKILYAWKSAGSHKKWLVIGGGITTDLVGFAASLVDASVTMMPSTVLSMIDASVGGKTGANFPPYGKNQVGSFYFPKEVVVWPGWLETLPARHLKSGGAECLKHGLLTPKKKLIRSTVKAISSMEISQISDLLPELIGVKSEVVSEDANEMGRRAILNLGHTMGHALEAVSHNVDGGVFATIEHGEAVAVGICYSVALSLHLGIMEQADHDMIWNLFRDSGCLISKVDLKRCLGASALNTQSLWVDLESKLLMDKKQRGSEHESAVRFILLKRRGLVFRPKDKSYTNLVTCKDMRMAWRKFSKLV